MPIVNKKMPNSGNFLQNPCVNCIFLVISYKESKPNQFVGMLSNRQIQFIAQTLQISPRSVEKTFELFDEGATLPFIARYRKEATGSLDEVQLAEIKKWIEKCQEADKRRISMLESIEEQGKLTPELKKKFEDAMWLQELEDLYLPYKQKRKTRATVAIEKGLEPLAQVIWEQKGTSIDKLVTPFLHEGVPTIDEALAGARDIMAEWVSEKIESRQLLRKQYTREAVIQSQVKKGKETEGEKYRDYFSFSQELSKIPSHRLLAIRRGEEDGILKVTLLIDEERACLDLQRQYSKGYGDLKDQVVMAIQDSVKRLLKPSLDTEFQNSAKEKADLEAIRIFAQNLRQLLLAAPLGQKRILAIDPGFRTGCKTVVLNAQGDLLDHTVIYPLDKPIEAEKTVTHWIEQYQLEAVAIGNGTASRETEQFIKRLIGQTRIQHASQVFVVSEQGASIYSASDVAREEFPNHDVTVRGAISIGRRLKDPLAELVKIDPKSIGVGQYQHDVNPKQLKESLDEVVISCVNQVGVELNTASKHLLSYVAGLGPALAQNIVRYRSENGPFSSRKDLKKVPRLGEKAFEQAAGFLRIRGGKHPLDNTGVHPERYGLVEKMAKDVGHSVSDLMSKPELRQRIDLKKYCSEEVGLPTLQDILKELEKPGRDPRETLQAFSFADIHKLEDLKIGMVVPGIVTNITAFGCFVDIGVHQDGLVHVSQMADRFIKDPNEVVRVHQQVKVKVVEVDIPRKRIALSLRLNA